MRDFDKTMLAYCGLYCEQCSFKLAHDENDKKHLEVIPYAFEPKNLSVYNCKGCKSNHCICGVCNIKPCASERNIDCCSNCNDFPCEYISAFESDGMPHHKKAVENLMQIKQLGFEKWFNDLKPTLQCQQCGEKQSWYYSCCKHN